MKGAALSSDTYSMIFNKKTWYKKGCRVLPAGARGVLAKFFLFSFPSARRAEGKETLCTSIKK